MKNKIIPTAVIILMFLLTSCSKKDDNSSVGLLGCTGLTTSYSTALANYIASPSKATCEEVVDAYNELVNRCAFLTAEQKEEYYESIGEVDCDQDYSSN